MAAIGKWLVITILGWLADLIRRLFEAYLERQRKKEEQAKDNKAAQEKLEQAQSEQEVIDAGSELLKRP